MVWGKLCVNCVVNPVTALMGVRNGGLEEWGCGAWEGAGEGRGAGEGGEGGEVVKGLVREVVRVGRAQGVMFPWERCAGEEGQGVVEREEEEVVVKRGLTEVLKVIRATATNVSSMLSDVRSRRETEIDAMNGEIVRLGTEAGIDTPYNRSLWELVRERRGGRVGRER